MTTSYHIDETEFPRNGSPVEQARFLLRYAVLAPSTHNTQPWKFGLSGNCIVIYADYTRRMPVVDPGNRELLMSIGAVIMNLRVAGRPFRLLPHGASGDATPRP
jgi:hypothetical protein